ncbi:hypothetical protein A606_02105 [Corynebacterium terpenotabidum Y-11]|uniref:Uncharacterized protein n=1 Tax=Corynebacterium terpenotabidum Y-11 TaxID=1200352 RepID=S4XC72_9CORY|nr:hypothetical protein A606_02105 [Corynebacterium terpenotabidum Y-11]
MLDRLDDVSQIPNPYNRPLPPEIYRRRRIAAVAVLVVVILVLWLIIRGISGGGSDGSSIATETSSTAVTSRSTTATTTQTTSASASQTSGETAAGETDSAETSAVAEPDEQCNLDDLGIVVQAGAPTYAAGELPDFYMTVTNPTETDCEVDLVENPMSFEVFTLSDYSRVWADTDCNEPASSGVIELAAGESRNYSLGGWSRTTSSPGECTDRQPVGTGSFLLYGHLGEKTSEPATFNLA